MKEIPLTQGKVALVDDEDFDVLAKHDWFAHKQGRRFYAMRNIRLSDGRRTCEYMHRVILERKLNRSIREGMHTDHENGIGLDNQRKNLLEVTPTQNAHNCNRHVDNRSSKYVGVTWFRRDNKWHARIMVNGKNLYLGVHATDLDAAKAREEYIAAHPELHARCNFASEGEI